MALLTVHWKMGGGGAVSRLKKKKSSHGHVFFVAAPASEEHFTYAIKERSQPALASTLDPSPQSREHELCG